METSEFKSSFMPFQPKMYRVAFSILRNTQDAEDIVQEAYLRLWKKRNEPDADKINEAYCVMMVRNLCIDFIRSSHGDMEGDINDAVQYQVAEDVYTSIEKRDEVRELKKLISSLPETQKKVVLLRDVNGLTFEEIERATGLGAVNIRATLSRARKRLREQFNILTGRR